MPVTYPVEKIIDEEGNVLALVDVSARALLGDDELLTNAKTCTGGINELKQSLTFNTLANVNYSSTSSNYEYVGIQIVVPTGKTALIVISTVYVSRSPQGLGLSLSSTLWDAANKQYWCELNPIKYTPAILLDSGIYYVWAKREGASGDNPYTVKGIIF